jgi:hypothetical protein
MKKQKGEKLLSVEYNYYYQIKDDEIKAMCTAHSISSVI